MKNANKTFHLNHNSFVKTPREYTLAEEITHAALHGLGALLGVLGLVLLILRSLGDPLAVLSSVIFGVSLIVLYLASCSYHTSCAIFGERPSRIREISMKCDHSLIYVLILGTYAPVCLSAMRGAVGYTVFAIVAASCLTGIVLNVINVERFARVSLVLYLVAGWTIAAAIIPFYGAVGIGGIAFLLLGGVSYTVGVFFYKAKHIKYMHIVWHIFVLLGSIFHYLMVYFYCL